MAISASVAWAASAGDLPQGLAVDEAGYVWAALRGADKVVKLAWDPLSETLAQDGERLTTPGPSELLYDGTFMWVTHSYIDYETAGPTVLSSSLSRVSTVTDQVMDLTLELEVCDPETFQVGAGPGRMCWDSRYLWLSTSVRMDIFAQSLAGSQTVTMGVPVPMQVNPVSMEISTGVPVQFMGELIAVPWVPGLVDVEITAMPIACDTLWGLWLSFFQDIYVGEVQLPSLCMLRIPKNCLKGEFDTLAIRHMPSGVLLTVADAASSGCAIQTEDAGAGVLEAFVGTSDGEVPMWSVANSRWEAGTTPDEKVKVSSADTTAGYLEDKLVAGAGITLTKLNPGANEQIEIKASWSGDTGTYSNAGSVIVGDVVYISAADTVNKADASAPATVPAIGIAVAVGASVTVQYSGEVALAGLTAGAEYFLATTPGTMSTSPPSVDGQVVQKLGYAKSTTVFVLNPDNTYGYRTP